MLKFIVNGQHLIRTDSIRPVEKTVNYLAAEFIFSKEWDTLDKKAIFKAKGKEEEYDAHIVGGVCVVPWEVVNEDGSFDISLKGTGDDVVITTSVVTVDIGETLVGGSESNPPSETEIEWMRRAVNDMEESVSAMEEKLNSTLLLVTLSEDMSTTSHSAEEIIAHVQNGGQAAVDFMGLFRIPYVTVMELESGMMGPVFSATAMFDTIASVISVFVIEKSAIMMQGQLLTQESLDGLIPSALPNPKELLIDGTRYDGSRSVSVSTDRHIVVTATDMQTASHSASVIRNYVERNFIVSFDLGGAFRLPYVGDADEQCVFAVTAGIEGEATIITIRVNEDKSIVIDQLNLGTREDLEKLIPSIPEKLPNPEAITIDGTVYDGSTAVNIELPPTLSPYAELVDDITVTEEGLTEIRLELDLQDCYEARIYTNLPPTYLSTNYTYYLTDWEGDYQTSLCNLSATANNYSGGCVQFKALTETLGEINYAAGLTGIEIDEVNVHGGQAQIFATKAPRQINKGTKLVAMNAVDFQFPVNTRVMTFAWKR